MYTSLYKMHQVSIHGCVRVAFDTRRAPDARARRAAREAALK
jgi:hypothetical protein